MEVAALIISILSLLVAVGIAILELFNNKRINDINLEAELSKDIIKEYLTAAFPKAVAKIHFKKRKLSNIVPLQNALNGLRNKLKFFKYCDPAFYNQLKKKTQELEDYIVNNEGKTYSIEDQSEVMQEICDQLTGIYTLLKAKYKNGEKIKRLHSRPKKHN